MYLLGCRLTRVGRIVNFWSPSDKHLVWLNVLAMLVNNPMNTF